MFEGFQAKTFEIESGIQIHGRVGGSGPPLLLLHGFPQTHVCWHKVALELASRFTVVATDLRGYGASSKPEGGENHINYSKRSMALDQVEVMRQLGSTASESWAMTAVVALPIVLRWIIPKRWSGWWCSTSRRPLRCTPVQRAHSLKPTITGSF